MGQSIESQLSIDDLRFIETEQFCAPGGVYRLKPGYLRFI
jgi:hypothetical protein